MIIEEKYEWVNALRGYAIFLVILIHSSQTFSVFGSLKNVCDIGHLGVQLFFILSSFTLFNSYNKRKLTDKHLKRNFFIRRFFRIAPYYYIAGLIYILHRILIKNDVVNIKNIISNYSFTNAIYLPGINDIPPGGWSVGIEMLFYLLIPILVKYIDSLFKAFVLFIVTMVGSILINHVYLDYTKSFISSIWTDVNEWAFDLWLPNQLPIFVLGILLYFIYKNFSFSNKVGQLMIILSVFFFFLFSFFPFSAGYPYYFLKKEYVYGVIFLFFAIGLYTTKNKFIMNSIAQKVGVISFSMYLNHFFILYLLGFLYSGFVKFMVVYIHLPEMILKNNIVFVISYLMVVYLTVVASKYSYQNVELKGIDLGNKVIKEMKKYKLIYSAVISEKYKS